MQRPFTVIMPDLTPSLCVPNTPIPTASNFIQNTQLLEDRLTEKYKKLCECSILDAYRNSTRQIKDVIIEGPDQKYVNQQIIQNALKCYENDYRFNFTYLSMGRIGILISVKNE